LDTKLIWLDPCGVGYYPVTDTPYDVNYWNRYREMEETPIGLALNKARFDLVQKYKPQTLLDVGIGSGAFVKCDPAWKGTDVNTHALEWLEAEGKLAGDESFEALTFWDSLEHIDDPADILSRATRFVFVSCPIYRDRAHVLSSKHFRPTEHFWYWTTDGAKRFLGHYGFKCLEVSDIESEIGREDIKTFVFERCKI
jgi:ubiquinone/menaquinone biosynthesis C-methylase UbiE